MESVALIARQLLKPRQRTTPAAALLQPHRRLASAAICTSAVNTAGRRRSNSHFTDLPLAAVTHRGFHASARATSKERSRQSTTDAPSSDTKSHVADSDRDETFAERAERARHEISVIHDVAMVSHVKEQLRALRAEASRPDLWDDSAHAATVVQQLGALEARETRVHDLHAQFLDCRELHALASEEHDNEMLRECMVSMRAVLADAKQLRVELLLSHASDLSSCFIEIQAGAGGTDSCDWAAMLARMYARWADARRFRVQYVSESPGDDAGFRAVCLRVDGSYAYGWAKTEAGVHRLVRLSPFDSAARRHTSFAQVRVYPLAAMRAGDKQLVSAIASKDLRVDTFRSSGAGGQHVNTTDSAVRITHLPTGIVVQSQSDRSQHRNKAEAMDMLRAKLYQRELDALTQAKHKFTRGLGDNAWGSQIRSYVLHPYKMVKDHRTNFAVTDPKLVLDGDLDRFMEEVLIAQASGHSDDDDDDKSSA